MAALFLGCNCVVRGHGPLLHDMTRLVSAPQALFRLSGIGVGVELTGRLKKRGDSRGGKPVGVISG